MKRLITILFLFGVAYGQVYPIPIVHENRNYHFARKVYIDQKLKIGDPLDPVINRKLHVVADTIRFEGLDGTGTFLTIDGSGDVIKGTVGAAGVTGLTPYEPLFGSLTGIIEQDNLWYYDPVNNYMVLGDPTGSAPVPGGEINVTSGTNISNMTASASGASVGVSSGLGQTYMDGLYYRFIDLDGDAFAIGRSPYSVDEVLLFPAAKGTVNKTLYVSGVSGDDVTLSWGDFTTGTVTSIATTSPITGGTITSAGTIGINNAAADGSTKGAASFTANDFDASSGNISIDYTNGQKASASVSGFVSTAAQDIAGVKTFQSAIELEGATADANETTITATDPTADNTVTVQNITGTIPMAVGTPVSLTGQTAAIAATTAYTAPADGYYAVYYNATVTTAATTSCVLGPFQVKYTEATDNVVKTFPTSSVNFITQTNRNNTDAAIGGMFMVHAKSGSNIQYIMGYTSSGATAMQYNLEITIIKIR